MLLHIIIPISKLLGNYNDVRADLDNRVIIPISKLLGNYNLALRHERGIPIIPISKLLGNYNTLETDSTGDELYQYLNC